LSWQWGALVGLGHRRVCCSAGAGSSIIKPRCHVEMVFLHPQHVAAAALLFAVLCAVCPVLILIYRVLFPTVLRFPWREHNTSRQKDKDTTVVFAGSFNPPHFGHLVMLRYLAERYGRVICCIGVNPNKTYDVTPQARASILRKMCEDCSNIRVQVVSGYIWRYARAHNASFFFRGIRTWEADGSEERQLLILNSWGPLLLGKIWPTKTVFLEGDPRYRDVSSTLVRRLCAERRATSRNEGDEKLARLIPSTVLTEVVAAYG